MIIGSIAEDKEIEKRVAITPEIVKKYKNLGFEIHLIKNYASHLGFEDTFFSESGAKIINDENELLKNSDIVIQLGLLNDNQMSMMKENQILIGSFNSHQNKNKIQKLSSKNINVFSLELLPRITRAQSMDILSSQANLAGYKAVIESFSHFGKAKRMGAIVFATDVRIASKEQVESLGGKFLTIEGAENLETESGYAKEASENFKKKQELLLSETLKKTDIVICTALIPGKKAPIIIKDNMINNMKPGSIIYDLAASQGGNTAFTEVDKVVNKNGVKIMGEKNILNKLPVSASNLYAKNLYNFILNLYDKENKKININIEDEIINNTLVK